VDFFLIAYTSDAVIMVVVVAVGFVVLACFFEATSNADWYSFLRLLVYLQLIL
jgi:hypothetical protein